MRFSVLFLMRSTLSRWRIIMIDERATIIPVKSQSEEGSKNPNAGNSRADAMAKLAATMLAKEIMLPK